MTSPSRRRAGTIVAIALAVVGLDQWTKSWAEHALADGPRHVVGPVQLVLIFNRGAAFSLGSGVTPVIEVLAVGLVALVLWQSGRLARRGASGAFVVGFGLLTGGAVSNLADRFVRHHGGAVVDFVQLIGWWPVFNLADVAITVGAVLVAVNALFFSGRAGSLSGRSGGGERAAPAGEAPAGDKAPGGGAGARGEHALASRRRGRG